MSGYPENLRRFQVVWWWRPSEWQVGFERPADGLRHIYRWLLQIGPLDIRRWKETP